MPWLHRSHKVMIPLVSHLNFATERAACNGSAPAGASPATVLPQEGCVVIPDSGSG